MIAEKSQIYNIEKFEEFLLNTAENEYYELIDGHIYMQAAPSPVHQDILGFLHAELWNFLKGKKCRVSIAPYDVFIGRDADGRASVVQPDIFVTCDESKRGIKGYMGTPDFIIEIVSPSSGSNDYFRKLNLYVKHGVKEYWIVNPQTRQTAVYEINGGSVESLVCYNFGEKIPSTALDGFSTVLE